MAYRANSPSISDDTDSEFFCGRCGGYFTTLSGTRPPIYNPDNCSCAEAADPSHNFGGSTVLLQSEHSFCSYDNTTAILFERLPAPVSIASSDQSLDARGPEEPDRELPNTQLTSGFLPVVPEVGLGEERHRRSSFRSEMSYQLRRYMKEQQDAFEREQREELEQHSTTYSTSHRQLLGGNRFLTQDVYMCPISGRGSGKTKSWESGDSGSSGESPLEAWETTPSDQILGTGTWAFGEGTGLGIGGVSMERRGRVWYPSSMSISISGMTERD